MLHSSQRDNNLYKHKQQQNPENSMFLGFIFYPIPSVWCLFGVCSAIICSIVAAVSILDLSNTPAYVSAVTLISECPKCSETIFKSIP